MGMYDEVEGILEPYDRQFKVWNDVGAVYQQGDEVPDVGMANTYAVRLNAPGAPARYLTVQEGKITNLMAHQPVYGKSVFDKWGSYLGRGGEKVDEPGPSHVQEGLSLLEMATPKRPAPAVIYPDGTPPMITHKVHLRADLTIDLTLPVDLNDDEAERLSEIVKALPFAPRF